MLLIERHKLKYYEFYFEGVPEGKYQDVTCDDGLIRNLREEVVFSRDLKFRDLFNHLLREKKSIQQLFRSWIGNLKLDDFVHDINKKYPEEKGTSLSAVQLSWRTELSDEDFIEIECQFNGVGKDQEGNREQGIEKAYGIDLSPLCIYADLPIRLNKTFIVERYRSGKEPSIDKVLRATREFTVFDIIDAILYTITWHGLPENRDVRMKSLENQVKQIEEDKRTGKIKEYKTAEQVKKELGQWLKDKEDCNKCN